MSARWDPTQTPEDLVLLTNRLGEPERDLVIIAEGNTSVPLSDAEIIVKASGCSMKEATAEDFVIVDSASIVDVIRAEASSQDDLSAVLDAGVHEGVRRRASIEAPIHAIVHQLCPTAFVGHTHPTDVVGVLSSTAAATAYDHMVYSDEAVVLGIPLYVPYAQPGIALGREFERRLSAYLDEHGRPPGLVLLGNHGIVALSATAAGVERISEMAVKGARVRVAASAMGGIVPLPDESLRSFFQREDIRDRQGGLR